jgi:Lon protease-like protein
MSDACRIRGVTMSDLFPLAEFTGQARLFPLPNLVFFPQVMQPLHIFEPRYREMTADALDGDRLIAMVLPRPGWEKAYAGNPPIHSVACLGRILAEHKLEDGRFNILLRGLARIRIIEEIPSAKLYRLARCEALEEEPIAGEARARHWRTTLADKAPRWLPAKSDVAGQLDKLLASDLSLGALCDILAFAMPVDAEFKQTLLAELRVEARLQLLHDFLESAQALKSQRHFPPEFSVN